MRGPKARTKFLGYLAQKPHDSTAPILTSLGANVRTRTCQKLQGRTKYKVLKWVNRRLWGSCKCTNKPLVHVHVQTIHDAVEGKGKGEEVLRQ